MAELNAIWIKRVRRGKMDPVSSALLQAGHGIVGTTNVGGRRQVTIIEREVWDRHMAAHDASLDPSTRRANLMVSGCALADSRGRVLRIGDCRVRILGETKPCEQMEEALAGLRETMYANWGGGAFGEVLTDGTISVGDVVGWDDSA